MVSVFPILFTTSMPLVTLPNTGCCDGVWPSNQSRNELCTVLMKNCEPPLLGWPVLAMERVPGRFEVLSMSSSGMLPASRLMVFWHSKEEPPWGPPVPARGDWDPTSWGSRTGA